MTSNVIYTIKCDSSELDLKFDIYNDEIIILSLVPSKGFYTKYHKSVTYIFLFEGDEIKDYFTMNWRN
jgi:hypothetical protein